MQGGSVLNGSSNGRKREYAEQAVLHSRFLIYIFMDAQSLQVDRIQDTRKQGNRVHIDRVQVDREGQPYYIRGCLALFDDSS